MANPITIPRLGWSMEQGVFVGWLKADGATVAAGEALFTLEGEKATEDIECLDPGVLYIPPTGPRAGDILPVGSVIGYLLQPGEAIPTHIPLPEQPRPQATSAPIATVAVTPREHPASSPRARRTAASLGIDLVRVIGSGRTGRIRERDVLALASISPALRISAETMSTDVVPQELLHPVRPARRIIAERMLTSQRSTAPVTLTTTVDVTHLVALRNCWKAENVEPVPTYTDLFMKFTANALKQHPVLNSRWDSERILVNDRIHIGIAVDTEMGLVVPVLRDVPHLHLSELAARTLDLVQRARAGKLSVKEMQGGTFTVTSLGSLGIDAFTPIINYPECAILGIGRIRRCPAVVDDQIAIRDQVVLSLTFDHRITDGAPAARFLQTLSGLIENSVP